MSAEELGAEAQVAFTVRELFGKLDEKLDRIDGKLDGKVDRSEFVEFVSKNDRRAEDFGRRLGSLEQVESERRGVSAWTSKTWGVMGALGALLAALAAVFGVFMGGHF